MVINPKKQMVSKSRGCLVNVYERLPSDQIQFMPVVCLSSVYLSCVCHQTPPMLISGL